ncbi:peptide ABC transporter permease [Tetragenococcus halophilus subsp. flandriensis]|uniref:nickel/cobalt ABC transporter permease n=1 Tax=Tetragenococcus halophilus TaxID=51669 RepID=UPI0023E92227|nr:nickel/cobalt ABC transporter permease [Tetragenococcus halophilus]GMA08361.1 peptide ABC transporter permease [Tetragenococcus halophilus subsp. flandriensis]
MTSIAKLMKDRFTMICAIFLVIVILAGLLAPLIAPHNPIAINVNEKFAKISSSYPLGTDHLGRCIFSRLIYGVRTTVFLAFITMAATMLVGILLGVISGLFHGAIDEIIMRLCDVFLSFPSEIMILAIVGIIGPKMLHIVIAGVIAKWAWYTRMIRSVVIKYTENNYIQFARVAGYSNWHIIKHHIMRNIFGEIFVLATLNIGSVILSISALSFLGLGIQAPTPEWGMMLNEAKNVMAVRPEVMIPPGLAILSVVAAFNFLGDGLQKALNVKNKS